jgi:hypothetical protein
MVYNFTPICPWDEHDTEGDCEEAVSDILRAMYEEQIDNPLRKRYRTPEMITAWFDQRYPKS